MSSVKKPAKTSDNILAITKWSDVHVRVDRQFTDPESPFHLTVDELYLFILLSIDQRKDWSIFTSVYMIEQNMPVRYYKGTARNREVIKDCITSLAEKGIIVVHGYEDASNTSSTPPFYVRVCYDNFEKDTKEGTWKGFNQLNLDVLSRFTRIEHLYMYCTILSYDTSSQGGFKASYSRWAEILDRSTHSVIRYVKEVSESKDKLFHVNYGGYIEGSRTMQSRNIYRTTGFKKGEKTPRTLDIEAQIENNQNNNNELAFGTRSRKK